jgi:RHS repeat-associated protein
VSTPAGVSAAQSQSLYAGLGASGAASLADQVFHVGDTEGESPQVPAGAKITRYVGSYEAQVLEPDGSHMLEVSSMPWRTDDGSGLKPTSLALTSDGLGGFTTVRGVVPVAFPGSADGVITLPGGITVQDGAGGAQAGRVVGDRVFYANTATDTDFMASPEPNGVDAAWQLRSSASPDASSLVFSLPAGDSLTTSSSVPGGAVIVRGGQTVVSILAPDAEDAAGNQVPASYVVSGDTLTVNVDVSGGVQYPVLVDPNIYVGGYGSGVWPDCGSGGNSGFSVASSGVLQIWANAGTSSGYYQWVCNVPDYVAGTVGIAFAQASTVFHTIEGTNSSTFAMGIYSGSYHTIQAGAQYDNSSGSGGTEPLTTYSTYNTLPWIDFCASAWAGSGNPPCATPSAAGDTFQMQLNQYKREPASGEDNVYIGNLTLGYVDNTAPNTPSVSVSGGTENGWYGPSYPITVDASGSDNGLGIYQDWYSLTDHSGNTLAGQASGTCTPQPYACPETVGLPSSQYLNEYGVSGQVTLSATDENVFGSQTPNTQTAYYDGSVPNATLSIANSAQGPSNGQGGNEPIIGDSNYTANVNVTDGSTSNAAAGSGVKSFTYWIDNHTPIPENNTACGSTGPSPTSPGAAACYSMTQPVPINGAGLTAGPHYLTVEATSYAGDTYTTVLPFIVAPPSTQSLGPGSVDLANGGYSVNAADVDVAGLGQDLTVDRTFNSIATGTSQTPNTFGAVGPDWTLSLGGAAGQWQSVNVIANNPNCGGGTGASSWVGAVVSDSAGNQYCFTAPTGTNTFTSPSALNNWTLTENPTTYVFTMTDTAGDSVSFAPLTGGTGTSQVATTAQAGTYPWQIGVIYANETNSASQTYLAPQDEVVGLTSSGNACTSTNPTTGALSLVSPLPEDCRELTFQYGSSGSSKGQLQSVSLVAYPPGLSSTTSTPVADYSYDSSGYLTGEWNPQISPSLTTSYSYQENSYPLVTGITPPGQQAWTINYQAGNNGTLANVQRTDPTQPSGHQLAQWTVEYGVPLSNTGAPFTMNSSTVAGWGEGQGDTSFNSADVAGDYPATAVAIFEPDDVPSSQPPSLTDYNDATVYYLDTAGRTVNTARPGDSVMPAAITTTQYDENGNIASSMSATDRAELLAGGSGPCNASPTWQTLSTLSNYGPSTTSGPNVAYTELAKQVGPLHQVTPVGGGAAVCANAESDYTYESTAPSGLPAGFTPPALVATRTLGALESGGETDERTTSYSYSGLSTGYSGPSQTNIGWLVGEPTETTISGTVNGTTTSLTSGAAFDPATGAQIDAIKPASAASHSGNPEQDQHDTQTYVYSTGTSDQPSAPSACQNQPQLAGLPCQVGQYSQPTGDPTGTPAVPTSTYTYNIYEEPLTKVVASGTATRTTTDSYDGAGRVEIAKTVASTDGSGSTAQPEVQTQYKSTTGQVASTCDAPQGDSYGSGCTKTISYTYDPLGRLATYTDAGANTANYSYDIDGRISSLTDGTPGWEAGVDSYTYDATTGQLSTLSDQTYGNTSPEGSDSYTATYNADGQIATEAMLNGLTKAYSYDETGKPTSVSYTKTTGCSSNCTWLSDTVAPSIYGQSMSEQLTRTATETINNTSTVVNQNATNTTYTYDGAGRLGSAKNTPSPGIELASDSLGDASGGAWGITTGSDGNLWVTESWDGNVSKITPSGKTIQYATGVGSNGLGGITEGSDGNVWYVGGSATVGKITPSGTMSSYTLDSGAWPNGVAQGSTGYMRVAEDGNHEIRTITTSGTYYSAYSTTGNPQDIVAATNTSGAPTGTDWFSEIDWNTNVSYIGEINSSGTVTEYPLASGHTVFQGSGALAFQANRGTAGTVWFIDSAENKVGAFDVATQAVTYYPAPSDATLNGLTVASDGTIWLSEATSTGMVGQLNPSTSQITEYKTGQPGDGMTGIIQGPDGNIWLLDNDGGTVEQITSGTSTTRAYTFDADTNRTQLQTTIPSTGCSNLSCAMTQTNSYDQADRLDDTSITYDPFGDITTMPLSDAGGTPLTATYYSDGTNDTLTQGPVTVTNNLDPDDRTMEQVSTNSGTTTDDVDMYYDAPGDTVAHDWDDTTSTFSRYIPDITGNLAAIYSRDYNTGPTTTLTYQLANLQGSIVAQASDSTSATSLQSVTSVTEYGVPTTSTPAKYSWLGGKERETELPSGIVAMGARTYDPYTGTFTQPDPIQGGGATTYGYTNGDSVNETDLNGQGGVEECVKGPGYHPPATCNKGVPNLGDAWHFVSSTVPDAVAHGVTTVVTHPVGDMLVVGGAGATIVGGVIGWVCVDQPELEVVAHCGGVSVGIVTFGVGAIAAGGDDYSRKHGP